MSEGIGDAAGRVGLIGGIGLTEVSVYTQRPAPDGTFCGCPHVHAVTDEGYYVLRGSGWAEFHSPETGYRKVRLETGDYLHFPPGVMHRLVSEGAEGGLVILGLMGNGGMAERGEARVYFGAEVDADPAEYARRMSLPREKGLEGALLRRDLAAEAHVRLMQLRERDEGAYRRELRRFSGVHRAAMAERAAEWRQAVECGPMAWAKATLERINHLGESEGPAGPIVGNAAGSESGLGMCGTLRPMLRVSEVVGVSL
jgi:mannose-6-phosphate isomerase-like protein (cupin superfamily)